MSTSARTNPDEATATADSQPDAPPERALTITHTYAEGTTLEGTRRSDELYSLLRGHGWLYRLRRR